MLLVGLLLENKNTLYVNHSSLPVLMKCHCGSGLMQEIYDYYKYHETLGMMIMKYE